MGQAEGACAGGLAMHRLQPTRDGTDFPKPVQCNQPQQPASAGLHTQRSHTRAHTSHYTLACTQGAPSHLACASQRAGRAGAYHGGIRHPDLEVRASIEASQVIADGVSDVKPPARRGRVSLYVELPGGAGGRATHSPTSGTSACSAAGESSTCCSACACAATRRSSTAVCI
jgi:hypothetical protein